MRNVARAHHGAGIYRPASSTPGSGGRTRSPPPLSTSGQPIVVTNQTMHFDGSPVNTMLANMMDEDDPTPHGSEPAPAQPLGATGAAAPLQTGGSQHVSRSGTGRGRGSRGPRGPRGPRAVQPPAGEGVEGVEPAKTKKDTHLVPKLIASPTPGVPTYPFASLPFPKTPNTDRRAISSPRTIRLKCQDVHTNDDNHNAIEDAILTTCGQFMKITLEEGNAPWIDFKTRSALSRFTFVDVTFQSSEEFLLAAEKLKSVTWLQNRELKTLQVEFIGTDISPYAFVIQVESLPTLCDLEEVHENLRKIMLTVGVPCDFWAVHRESSVSKGREVARCVIVGHLHKALSVDKLGELLPGWMYYDGSGYQLRYKGRRNWCTICQWRKDWRKTEFHEAVKCSKYKSEADRGNARDKPTPSGTPAVTSTAAATGSPTGGAASSASAPDEDGAGSGAGQGAEVDAEPAAESEKERMDVSQ